MVPQPDIDLAADLNDQDDNGLGWLRLAVALDPSTVHPSDGRAMETLADPRP
jgi:hypothetical protein